jgi:flagellar hook-associated protein 3 FlgL
MRITQQMITGGAVQHMAENQDMMRILQEKIASGKSFEVSSDDPVNASLSLGLRSSITQMQNYLDTNDKTNEWLNATDFVLTQMQDAGTKAQNLILRGLNDSLGANERANSLAPDMGGLLKQALEMGNYTQNGQYIFSGVYTNTQTFSMDASTTPPTVVYNPRPAAPALPPPGINSTLQRTIAPNQNVTINIMGETSLKPFIQAISDAQQALQANDTTALQTALNALQSGMTMLDQARTTTGARLRQVQTAGDYMDKAQLEARGLLSKKEDANLAEAITTLKSQETTYQAVLQVAQRTISASSLFDLMR